MADEETLVESKADAETQAKAEKLGWIPPARFKGDVDRFVDAAEYIERGETVLPIVKEQNKRLHLELDEAKARQLRTEAALATATKAIDEINERHTVATQKAVEKAKAEVKAQLAAASEAGDHAAVAELTQQMVDLKDAEVPTKVEKKDAPLANTFVPPADLAEWNRENPWFGTNKRKTALALGIAQEMREGGETLTGRAFYEKVAAEVDKELGGKAAELPRGDKVDSARQEGDASRGNGKGKTFAALPADAKAACDSDARNFVGPNKKYKTQAEWRSRYAELYFQE